MASMFNPEILIFNATMADIPLCTGYTPAQWRKGLNVMIEKTPGNFNVEKLHIILLFEANFNSNNKWLRCTIMFNAKTSHMMAAEQYSSQKKKSAISQCLNKLLFYDIICFWQQLVALCSNDAKSCYNRIVLLIVALCLCHLRASIPNVFSMIKTLHQMEHFIHTTFGDSTKVGSCKKWDQPITGIGQGNGAGPQIWAAMSSLLFELLQQEGFCAHYWSDISCISKTCWLCFC